LQQLSLFRVFTLNYILDKTEVDVVAWLQYAVVVQETHNNK